MGMNYDAFMESATKQLSVIMSSPEYEVKEKNLIASTVSDEMMAHLNSPDNLPDADFLIHRTSIMFLDDEVTKILNQTACTEKTLQYAQKCVSRLEQLQLLFKERKYQFPDIQIKALSAAKKELEEKLRTLSLTEQIRDADRKLTSSLSYAAVTVNRQSCDEAEKCLRTLQELIHVANAEGVNYGEISNKNLKKCAATIEKYKVNAAKKAETDSQILDIDRKIQDAEIHGDTDDKYWSEAIKLSKKQDAFISDYTANQWPLPAIKRKSMTEVRDQFQTYQEIKQTDHSIRAKTDSVSTDTQLAEFGELCNKQESNVQKCKRKGWRVPGGIINDLQQIRIDTQAKVKEKKKAKARAARRAKAIAIIVAIVVVGTFIGIISYQNSIKDKQKSPYSSADVVGKSRETIIAGFTDAGFNKVEVVEDISGWLPDGQVTGVSIGKNDSFTKGQYYPEESKIVIRYSSSKRIEVGQYLVKWSENSPETVLSELKRAGFTKVSIQEVDTTSKGRGGKISELNINGLAYQTGDCYIPKNAPIIISKYVYKIPIGSSSADFSGSNYTTVVDSLKAKGYTNVSTEAVKSGWKKENTVISVSVNGAINYTSKDMFKEDAKIVVRYSSDTRIDATGTVKKWKSITLEEMQQELKTLGFTNIRTASTDTNDTTKHHKISGIKIGSESYESGEFHAQKSAQITIVYFRSRKSIGKTKDEIRGLGDYTKAKQYFTNRGFTNITFKRTDDLNGFKEWGGWIWGQPDKGVRNITINGKDNFKSEDVFYLDENIVILVNTYADRRYNGL